MTLPELTAQIVSAYVTSNQLAAPELPTLVERVQTKLRDLGQKREDLATQPIPTPAFSIRRSVQPDHIVCLEDGARVKLLKRHIRVRFGMSPDEYRAKWGLSADYPMVAPNYAAKRASMARDIGLGHHRKAKTSAPSDEPAQVAGPLFAADLADAAQAGKHTAESVFGRFGKDAKVELEQPLQGVPERRTRSRKPFAQQSVRPSQPRRPRK